MNGLGYGRYSGLSGSRNSMKEYANTYSVRDAPLYDYLDVPSPQNNRRQQGFNGRAPNAFSRFEDAMYSAIPSSNQSALRPHSAGSRATGAATSSARKSRSYGNINQPLTKQVDQLLYEIPDLKFTKNALCQAPEFLKVFSDVQSFEGDKAMFDCVLLGSPRPKVHWLFNDEKMAFNDVSIEDTADVCRCTINCVKPYHYGVYTVLAENEAGRAITTASLLPVVYNQF